MKPRGVTRVTFAGYVPLASQNPYPIIVYFWSILSAIIDPIIVTDIIVYFWSFFSQLYRPHLSHFWENDFLNLKLRRKCDSILLMFLRMPEKETPLWSFES